MICAGIDAGSRSTKVVLFDTQQQRVTGRAIVDQGVAQESLAQQALASACSEAGIGREQLAFAVATGYARNALGFANTTITEITCHARGVRHLLPEARSIFEIGGQDSKYIILDETGRVRDFAMNDRCAAGSGRFLEVVAQRLEMGLPQLGEVNSSQPALISSTCVVFAETEIIGLMAQNVPPADIAAGVQDSIAARVTALAGRTVQRPICFTGGVALQPGMVRAMERALGLAVVIPDLPQYTGALGAALLAVERGQPSTNLR